MTTDYYSHTTYPITLSPGSSANMRAQLDLIEAGFAKLPAVTGNAGKFTRVNDAGTAQTASTNLSETAAGLVISGTVTVSSTSLTWSGNPTHSGNHTFSGTVVFSNALGGTPLAPTASIGTNSQQIASCAFVQAAIANVNPTVASPTLVIDNTAGPIAAVAGQHIIATSTGAAVTVTLPASPASGAVVWIEFSNGRVDNIIARNGNNLMGLAEDMQVNQLTGTLRLRYANSSLGWRLV